MSASEGPGDRDGGRMRVMTGSTLRSAALCRPVSPATTAGRRLTRADSRLKALAVTRHNTATKSLERPRAHLDRTNRRYTP